MNWFEGSALGLEAKVAQADEVGIRALVQTLTGRVELI